MKHHDLLDRAQLIHKYPAQARKWKEKEGEEIVREGTKSNADALERRSHRRQG